MNTNVSATISTAIDKDTNKDIDVERQRVMEQVLDATTLPEIAAAKQILREWLTSHPEEQGMRAGFEQLYLLEEIAQEQEAKRVEEVSQARTQAA